MINAIFAVDHYGGMGFNGTLPWPHNAADLANFKKATTNHVVVMGRNTWDDPKMPKPLPERIVYVASKHPVTKAGRIEGDIVERVYRRGYRRTSIGIRTTTPGSYYLGNRRPCNT